MSSNRMMRRVQKRCGDRRGLDLFFRRWFQGSALLVNDSNSAVFLECVRFFLSLLSPHRFRLLFRPPVAGRVAVQHGDAKSTTSVDPVVLERQ